MLELFLFFSAAIEIGPQPTGVVRADIFNMAKEAVDLTVEWIQGFNSGKKQTLVFKASDHPKNKKNKTCFLT